MVGVGKYYLRTKLFQLVRRKRLYRSLRSDGHKHGRFDHAVRRGELAHARARLLTYMYFLK